MDALNNAHGAKISNHIRKIKMLIRYFIPLNPD